MYHLSMGVGHCKSSPQFSFYTVVLIVVISIAEHVHGEPVKIYILRMFVALWRDAGILCLRSRFK